jgi:hypothetical protein
VVKRILRNAARTIRLSAYPEVVQRTLRTKLARIAEFAPSGEDRREAAEALTVLVTEGFSDESFHRLGISVRQRRD